MPADFFLWGQLKGKVYKNTPRTIEQFKYAIRQEIQAVIFDTLGKSIPEFGETHSSLLECERRTVSACFASFLACVYKFSSHYLNNTIFIDNSLGPLARDSPCMTIVWGL